MPKRDVGLLLEDIVEAIDKIARYTADVDRDSFLEDEKTIDAVVRNLEIIGEATRQLPDTYTAKHGGIPWRQIAGLRNRIVHDYFGLDLEIIWGVITNDLPNLKSKLNALLTNPNRPERS